MVFLALIYLAFVSLGLPDSLLGSSWPLMQQTFGVPVRNAGYISVAISCSTIVSSLFSHRVIQRFGTGKVTAVSVAMTALALLGFSYAPSFYWLLLLAIPLGLGAGAVDSGLNEFVAEHYEAYHMSWLHCSWGVGAMLGPVLISFLSRQGGGWRSGYFGVAMIQVVLVVLLLFSLPMWKKMAAKALPNPNQAEKLPEKRVGLFNSLRLAGAPSAMLAFFFYTAAENTFMLWGASYLVNTRGLGGESAAGWSSLFFVGITLGRFISGFASLRIGSEGLIRIGEATMFTGLILLLLPLPVPFALAAFVLVGTGFAPVFPSLLHQTPVYFGKENAQGVMSLQMASAYAGITLIPPLFGQIFERSSFHWLSPLLLLCGIGLFLCTKRLSGLSQESEAK
ncbi:MFS transporter [Oscillospiraceae bacterium MB08-C2-2]|nr:MFS transporter [Oscillospiraceae bacterium MB08-C2-2]